MEKSKKAIELPLVEPIYSTFHHQGSGASVIESNPSIRNWYLNQGLFLRCNRKFLSGFTTPQLVIMGAIWFENPYLEKIPFNTRFTKGYMHAIIHELLDQGYYVHYDGIDDYYVEGKTWYKEKHFSHDGLICGYDQNDKTYMLYAYDSSWIYKTFKTPQASLEKGRKAMAKQNLYVEFTGIKPKDTQVKYEIETVRQNLIQYLDSSLEKYPPSINNWVHGLAVHDYLAMYVDKLLDGSIPYEKMDWRIFRIIWEHKKVMLERLQKGEETLSLDSALSTEYQKLVKEADTMRMLYASHHMKRRDSVLPIIRQKLLSLKEKEQVILTKFVENTATKTFLRTY